MKRIAQYISKTLSVHLSLWVVVNMSVLLTIALFIMFQYSRKAMKEEALHKASQTLEATVLHIDNILLNVEQASGNIYFHALNHLDSPDEMFVFSRRLVESSPYIQGCAIAFEPSFYKDRGKYFMAYVHHSETEGLTATNSPIIQSETFGNLPYTEQRWYTVPVESKHPCWINPTHDNEPADDNIITFSIPFYNKEGKIIGVLGVDVSLSLLSDIVFQAKPSPNSYCTLLAGDGSYIVHPDSNKLLHQNVLTQTSQGADSEVKEAAQAMLSGETGYKRFYLNGTNNYIFYKPFKRSVVPGRSTEDLGWSVGIIYPENDIFDDYNRLLYVVIAIAVAGMLLMLVFCQIIAHRQLLPLRTLSKLAQRIANGHYEEAASLSSSNSGKNKDEVGRLQRHFQKMMEALSKHMEEMNKLTDELKERGEGLQVAYQQAQEADRVKTAVLHNMTNKMMVPVDAINTSVTQLCENYSNLEKDEANLLVNDIQHQGITITELLNELLEESQKDKTIKE